MKFTPKRRFNRAYKEAIRRNLEWDITLEQYTLLLKQPCDYCGNSIEKMEGCGLDRKNSDIGYVISNVVSCCWSCNVIKNQWLTHEEMKIAMSAIISYRESLRNHSNQE